MKGVNHSGREVGPEFNFSLSVQGILSGLQLPQGCFTKTEQTMSFFFNITDILIFII